MKTLKISLSKICKIQKPLMIYAVQGIKISMVMVLFLSNSVQSEAAVKTWTNSGSDNQWSTAANWSPSGVPGTADVATFSSTGTAINYKDNSCDSLTPGYLDFENITLALASNASFTVNGTSINSPLNITGKLTLNSVDYIEAGVSNVAGNFIIKSITN